MAVEAITAVERSRDTFRFQSDRVRLDKTRADQIEADGANAKRIEQNKLAEREQLDKAAVDKDLQRAQTQKDSERQRLQEQQLEREALRLQARRQAELDRRAQIESTREAGRALQNQSDRARLEGLNAYRAQTARAAQDVSTDRLSIEQIQSEPGRTLREQLTALAAPRIDRIDLSDIARARLQGAVGLTIIPPATAASNLTVTA